MKIACLADVHYPTNYQLLLTALKKFKSADVVFLAGDIAEHFKPGGYRVVVETLRKYYQGPIYAVFGNAEHSQDRNKIRKKNRDVTFLEDEAVEIDKEFGLVGTQGSLDEPTTWQASNVRNIETVYKDRVKKVENLLKNLRTPKKILLMHYAPTHDTLGREPKNTWGRLSCRAFEGVIKRQQPVLVVHAHAHLGSPRAVVYSVPVYNVSLPLNERIVVIDTEKLANQSLKGFA